MGAGDMVACSGDVFIGQCAEGVEPGMDFDATFVRFIDTVGEGIVTWGFSHGARNPMAVRFEIRAVNCIGIGAHLEYDGIEFEPGSMGDEAT